MPNILYNNSGGGSITGVNSIEQISPAQKAKVSPYGYKYPDGLDMRPGSVLHDKIKNTILSKANASQKALQTRFSDWREVDRTLTAYIRLDKEEQRVKNEDDRKPVSVVVPVSYATIETLLTYWVAAFLEEPYFRYEGVGPEDIVGATLLEMLVAQQCRRSKVGLEMHTMWRDSLAYGFGAVHIGWERRTAYRTANRSRTVWSALKSIFVETGEMEEVKERKEIFNGSTLTALDPYMCLPDPDTPIQNVRDSEFFGWVTRRSTMSWLSTERDNDDYFNMKYLRHFHAISQYNTRGKSGREDKHGYTGNMSGGVTQPADVINIYMKIIPKDFGLGDEEYPEIWLFGLAGDQVVVRAQPLGLDHDQIPIAIAAPDFDGHSITPISRLETVLPLQQTLDWLFKSHIANVRKAINDVLIVDPQMVNIHDLANPTPGGIIRTRRQAWGRGVKDMVMQLDVSDVTKGNISDSSIITQIIRETTGSMDAVSGIRRKTSERVSAAEATQTARSALSRLEKSARITSLQAHYDIAYQMAWNTRQLMSEDQYVKILGDSISTLLEEYNVDNNRVAVSPKDLDIDFDVIPHDGTIPSAGDAQTFIQLYQIIATNPELIQKFDMVRIFKHIARLTGAKNINDFVASGGNVSSQVLPNETVASEVQKGNLAPIRGL